MMCRVTNDELKDLMAIAKANTKMKIEIHLNKWLARLLEMRKQDYVLMNQTEILLMETRIDMVRAFISDLKTMEV